MTLGRIRGKRCSQIHGFSHAQPARRIRNKGKLKAFDLVDPSNRELRTALQKAEYAMTLGDDVVDGDEAGEGPPSDSD